MSKKPNESLEDKLDRLIAAVSRLAPREAPAADIGAADCFVWAADPGYLEPVHRVNRVDIGLIRGVDRVRDILVDNTERFAAGLPANNVLLWGARGMGKSSLVKAVHARVNAGRKGGEPLKLATKVELRLKLERTVALNLGQKRRLSAAFPAHVTQGGDFIVTGDRFRSRRAALPPPGAEC